MINLHREKRNFTVTFYPDRCLCACLLLTNPVFQEIKFRLDLVLMIDAGSELNDLLIEERRKRGEVRETLLSVQSSPDFGGRQGFHGFYF